MSAEIRKLKDGSITVLPLTVGTAVNLDDGTTVQDLADKVVITDQAEYASTLVKSDSSVYVVKKSNSFGGVTISNPLIYRNNEFQITEDWWDAWDNNSYDSSYGTVNGSTYFSFIDIGKRFDSRGANFNENSGDIDNANTLDGWRVPTIDELNAIFGTSRPGATVDGVSGVHYVVIYDSSNNGPSSADGTPNGILLFPDGETIEDDSPVFGDLGSYKDTSYDTDLFTKESIDYYVNQGCVYMPGVGWYYNIDDEWSELHEYVEAISATEAESSGDCRGVYFQINSDGSCEDSGQEKSTAVSFFLVKPSAVNPGVYVGDEEVTSGTGGGGGGSIDMTVLKTVPTFKKVRVYINNVKTTQYVVEHPYMNMTGAEIVLVRYNKKNGKKLPIQGGYRHHSKKGWGIASGPRQRSGVSTYFTFSHYTNSTSIGSFYNTNIKPASSGHFGIALRIPNPEWTRSATLLKNGIYQGIHESLWSDVLSINVHTLGGSFAGIGVLR